VECFNVVNVTALKHPSQDLEDLDRNVLVEKDSHGRLRGLPGSIPVNIGSEGFRVESASGIDRGIEGPHSSGGTPSRTRPATRS